MFDDHTARLPSFILLAYTWYAGEKKTYAQAQSHRHTNLSCELTILVVVLKVSRICVCPNMTCTAKQRLEVRMSKKKLIHKTYVSAYATEITCTEKANPYQCMCSA